MWLNEQNVHGSSMQTAETNNLIDNVHIEYDDLYTFIDILGGARQYHILQFISYQRRISINAQVQWTYRK